MDIIQRQGGTDHTMPHLFLYRKFCMILDSGHTKVAVHCSTNGTAGGHCRPPKTIPIEFLSILLELEPIEQYFSTTAPHGAISLPPANASLTFPPFHTNKARGLPQ